MKTTFQFKVENISTEEVKLNGVDVLVSGEINAEELESMSGFYAKLMEAVASIGMMVQKLENGEPLVQNNSNENEEMIPSDGASKSKACKKAKTLKGEKKRGRKAAKKLEELLKKDNEDAQAEAGWDVL